MNENREQIQKDNPKLSMTEMSKKAGEMWQGLKDKSEWNTKAEEDKKQYERELEKWRAEGGTEALRNAKRKAKKKQRGTGGSESSSKKSTETPKHSSSGTGTHYKSKEYIESGDDSSD